MRSVGWLPVGSKVASRFDAADPTVPSSRVRTKYRQDRFYWRFRTPVEVAERACAYFTAIFSRRDITPTWRQPGEGGCR